MQRRALALTALVATSSLSSLTLAADTACEVTLNNGGLVDVRNFPVTAGDTVINARTDGSTSCTILGLFGTKVNYPSGLTINTNGTDIIFNRIESDIQSGLTVNDGGIGSGRVVFEGQESTRVEGPVSVENGATLKFVTHNTGSSNTRLRLADAYINTDSSSELQVEYKLGDTTGGEFLVGSLSGAGSLRLSNVGTSSRSGRLVILSGDGLDYSYAGDITYENQNAPSITKSGAGSFTFTGDIINASGVQAGFNDGFDDIEVNDGELILTSDSFIFGSDVQLNGGSLVLDQDFSGTLTGADFEGTGTLAKRGTGTVTLQAISRLFRGKVSIEEGTLGLSGTANLSDADLIDIKAGATLDISNASSSTSLSRITGSGTLALGDKEADKIIRIKPGNSIGVFSVTGSGNLNLNGTLVEIEMDPTQAIGDAPGVTHDQLAVAGSVSANTGPFFELLDIQNGSSPSAFLNGREFTIATAGSGLTAVSTSEIFEGSSFHAFVGADPDTAIITDTEVKVQFGIKTVQQVATTIASTTVATTGGSSTTGSKTNKSNAAKQIIQQTTGLTGTQAPTQAQLTSVAALQTLTNQKLATAANNNNPEAFSSNLSVNLEYADFVGNLVMDRAAGRGVAIASLDDGFAEQEELWANFEYSDGDVEGEQDETGNFDYTLSSFLVGRDFAYERDVKLGLFVGAGTTKMDEHDHILQDIEGNVFQFGGYSAHERPDGYRFSTLLMATYGQFDSSRTNLDLAGNSDAKSDADYDTYGLTLGFKFSKNLALDERWTLTPSAGLAYTYLHQESINEENGGAAYDYEIDQSDADALVFSVGLDASYSLKALHESLVADLRARYEFDAFAEQDSTHDLNAGLVGQSKNTFVGQNRGAHGVILGAGMISELNEALSVGLGYEYAKRSAGEDSSIGLDIFYRL